MPSTSLVWPSNCGSGSRTPITAVSPSSASSLLAGSSPFFSSRAARSCAFSVLTRARSNPVTCVPPLGVAITLTNDTVLVSYPVLHCRATSTCSSRSTSVGVMCPCSSSTGTVSLNWPAPVSRSTSVSGSPGDRYAQNSLIPPSKRNSASFSATGPGPGRVPGSVRGIVGVRSPG